jgi:hypothetical protein
MVGNGSALRTEPLTGCGAVVDMRSGTGRLVILGSDNLPINTIETDPRNTGRPYVDIRIPDGCICEVQGNAVIFLYCHIMSKTPDPVKEDT